MDKKIYLTVIVILALALVSLSLYSIHPVTTSAVGGIKYNTKACISKNGVEIGCYHNIYTSTGKEIVKSCLGQGVCAAVTQISLCNSSAGCAAPTATTVSYANEYDVCGLTRAAGTFSNNSDPGSGNVAGNYSIYKVFTSSCDNIVVNGTAINNNSGAQKNFSLAVVGFPNVTLAINDQLTINWTIYTT